MGSWFGGNDAPAVAAPDPALVKANIDSLGVQSDAIKQVMANSNAIAPLQRQQMQDSITRGTELYGQSQDDRVYGLQRRGVLTGLQDQMTTDAQTYNSADRREQMAGEAQADVASAYDNSAGQLSRGLERSGVNVNSARYVSMQNQNSLSQATASASAANKTRQAARLEGFQLTDRASNAFSGYPASTSGSVGTGLSTAGFGLASANSGLAGMNSGYNTAGGMAGQMGTNATGMFNAQASYKAQQDKLAADNDPFKLILGAAAAAGSKAAFA